VKSNGMKGVRKRHHCSVRVFRKRKGDGAKNSNRRYEAGGGRGFGGAGWSTRGALNWLAASPSYPLKKVKPLSIEDYR